MSQEQVISKLIGNAPCQLSNLTDCQIEALRGSITCGVGGCSSSGSIAACSDTASSVFETAVETGDYKCCGLTIGAFVGIIVAVAIVLIIIIVIFVCKYRRAQAERQQKQQ